MSPFELALPETTNRQLLVDLVGVEHLRESQFRRFRQLLSATSGLQPHHPWSMVDMKTSACCSCCGRGTTARTAAVSASCHVLSAILTTTHHDTASVRLLSSAALFAAGALLSRTRELAVILGIVGSYFYSIVSRRPITNSTCCSHWLSCICAGPQARR